MMVEVISMSSKKLYTLVIICGVILVLGSLFIMLATRTLKKYDTVQASALVFVVLGAVFFIGGIGLALYTAYSVLKDKRII